MLPKLCPAIAKWISTVMCSAKARYTPATGGEQSGVLKDSMMKVYLVYRNIDKILNLLRKKIINRASLCWHPGLECRVPWFSCRNTLKQLDTVVSTYLDTWSGFEAAKTAPWPSRGLHHFGKFLEPSDERAGRGCCCFLMWWYSWAFLADQEWAPETCRAQILIFQF